MNTNTFYKPKNEFGELLASIPYVTDKTNETRAELKEVINNETFIREAEDNNIRTIFKGEVERLDSCDKEIHNKIETFNTIKVKWINADRGENKCSNIDEYFKSVLDENSIFYKSPEELRVELGQTIYIIEGKDDEGESGESHKKHTYEEWVCLYPDLSITEDGLPIMIRLGAIDSILARHNSPGSVKLVHNLYGESVDWSKYFELDYNGNLKHNEPIKGEAVAPCALRAFYDADQEIIDSLEMEVDSRRNEDKSIREEFNTAITKLTNDYIVADNQLHADLETAVSTIKKDYTIADANLSERITTIEKELEGSEIENNVGIHGSRLDRIEAAIGINGYCMNCGKTECCCHKDASNDCHNVDNMCTIYCRLHDVEGDTAENNEQIIANEERISMVEERLANIGNNITDDIYKNASIEEVCNTFAKKIKSTENDTDEIKVEIIRIENALDTERERSIRKDAEQEQFLNDLNTSSENLYKLHFELQKEVRDDKQFTHELASTVNTWAPTISNADARISDLGDRLVTVDRVIASDRVTFNNKIAEVVASIAETENDTSSLISDVYNIKEKINENANICHDLRNDIDTLDGKCEDFASFETATTNRFDGLEAAQKNEKARLDAITSRVDAADERLDIFNDSIINVNSLIEENAVDIDKINAVISETNSEEGETLWGSININASQINELQSVIGSTNLNDNLTIWDAILENGEAIKDNAALITTLQSGINEHEQKITYISNAIENELPNALTGIWASIEQLNEDKKTFATIDKLNVDLQLTKNELEESISDLIGQKEATTQNLINNINARIGSDNDSSEGSTIHAKLNKHSLALAAIEDLPNDVDKLNESLDELKETYDNSFDIFKNEIRNDITDVNNLVNTSIESVKNSVNDLYEAFNSKVDTTIQFVVRTTLENGVKEIKVPVLFDDKGSGSSEWGRVQVNSVVAVIGDSEQCIYPEIIYTGSNDGEGKDTRQITINFGMENIETYITFSAFKHNKATIKTI